MPCKSFYCKRCGRSIPCRKGDLQSCIRTHYWTHHKPTMMKKR